MLAEGTCHVWGCRLSAARTAGMLLLVLLALLSSLPCGICAPPRRLPPLPSPGSPPPLLQSRPPPQLPLRKRPSPPLPRPMAALPSLVLQGQLLYRVARPSGFGRWVLLVSDVGTYTLPQQPMDTESGRPLQAGSVISLTCYPSNASPDDLECVRIEDARIWAIQAGLALPSNVTLQLLVVLISLNTTSECHSASGASVSQVKLAFSGEGRYPDFFRNCSYGSMTIDRSRLMVVAVELPCSRSIMSCKPDVIGLMAQMSLASKLNFDSYSHVLFVLPAGFDAICGWVGMAEIPGTRSWYTPDDGGIFSKGTVMQQILQNWGLYVAWRNGIPYNDYSTAMGMGDCCPSAPELWRLGWATPLAQLNSTSLPANAYRTFTLPATYLGPDSVLIKIQPDWLGDTRYSKNLYLALRIQASGDKDLLAEFHGKLNVHEVNSTIDNSPVALGDPSASLLQLISPVASVALFNYRLHIITGGLIDFGTAMVLTICRFVVGPTDCSTPPSSPPSWPDSPPSSPPPPPPVKPPPPSPRPLPPRPRSSPPPRPPPPSPRPPRPLLPSPPLPPPPTLPRPPPPPPRPHPPDPLPPSPRPSPCAQVAPTITCILNFPPPSNSKLPPPKEKPRPPPPKKRSKPPPPPPPLDAPPPMEGAPPPVDYGGPPPI